MLLVHFLPKIAVWVAFVLAIILLTITAIVFFVDSRSSLSKATGWGIFLAILALVIALILLFYLIVHHKKISYCSIFLANASLMLKEKCITFFYILLFMVLTFVFSILIVFQYLAFSSVAAPTFNKDELYSQLSRNFWFMAPLVIETLWGLSFLRDACNFLYILVNFCVSGCAIQWYFKK